MDRTNRLPGAVAVVVAVSVVLIALGVAGRPLWVGRTLPYAQEGRSPLAPLVEPLLEANQRLEGIQSSGGLAFSGLAVQIHTADRAAERYGKMIDEIARLGADTVLLSVDGYQERIDSVLIETDPARTPADKEMLSLFARAHDQGLAVILMPKILLRDPQDGHWRGKIEPPTWDGWFGQYRKFVLRFARLAERGGVEVFVVGSELISSEKHTSHWLETLDRIRDVYHGKLAYSANWDHYASVQFWDRLDLIGLTSYFKLADEPGPSRDQLLTSWKRIKPDIRAFAAKVGKPLLFTEVGWCSQEGCSIEAWNYYRHNKSTPAALEEQRLNYEAFIATWADDPMVGGIIWWEWTDGAGGPKDHTYTPKRKPAQEVLRKLFGRNAKPHAGAPPFPRVGDGPAVQISESGPGQR